MSLQITLKGIIRRRRDGQIAQASVVSESNQSISTSETPTFETEDYYTKDNLGTSGEAVIDAGNITTGILDGDRLPAMSTGKKGAVPALVSVSGKVLEDGGWISKNSLYTAFQTLTDGATITWNLANGYNAKVTLGGNRTLSLSGLANGMSGCLIVKQDGTGARTLELPSGSKQINGGIWALSTAANAIDVLTFIYDGTDLLWSLGKNFIGVI